MIVFSSLGEGGGVNAAARFSSREYLGGIKRSLHRLLLERFVGTFALS